MGGDGAVGWRNDSRGRGGGSGLPDGCLFSLILADFPRDRIMVRLAFEIGWLNPVDQSQWLRLHCGQNRHSSATRHVCFVF